MIYIITESQKNILLLQNVVGIIFNPIQDLNNNWLITENEYYYCLGLWYLDELNLELQFIKNLVLSEYFPKINEII